MSILQYLIELLQLEPLPVEGGYFRLTYCSDETIDRSALPTRYTQAKAFGSAIYFLLHGADFSTLHRLRSDEVYHFYLGDPVELLLLFPDGSGEVRLLGSALEAGQQPQTMVPRGIWQGLRLKPGGHYALMGTTLAPAYDPSDFEPGEREMLIQQYPAQAPLIRALTRT